MDTKRALCIEKMIAKFLKWKRVAFSGAKWDDKEDLRSNEYLGQVKATDCYTIKIDSRDIRKLEENSIKYRKKPAFIIHYDNKTPINSTWVAIPIKNFRKMINEEEEEYEV